MLSLFLSPMTPGSSSEAGAGAAPAPTAEGAASLETAAEYTIDELARVSQVPSRTIRFYQSKGVLPRPEIRGRVAYYTARHRERLELIASLQDRGLRMDAIRDLLTRVDRGEVDVAEWLGLEEQLQRPWAEDRARTMTEEELFELAGRRRVGLLNDLVRAGLVKREGDVLFVGSPTLVQVMGQLEAAGVDLEVVRKGGDLMRKHLGRLATELTELFLQQGYDAAGGDPAALLARLRPLSIEALRTIFAQEMERVLRGVVESGRSAKVSRRRR